jgi:hypothetical protein
MLENLQTAADLPKIGHILKIEYISPKVGTSTQSRNYRPSQSVGNQGLMYGRFVADFSAAKNFITIY